MGAARKEHWLGPYGWRLKLAISFPFTYKFMLVSRSLLTHILSLSWTALARVEIKPLVRYCVTATQSLGHGLLHGGCKVPSGRRGEEQAVPGVSAFGDKQSAFLVSALLSLVLLFVFTLIHPPPDLTRYSNLFVVLKGFTQIMEQLFGLTLVITPAHPSETWAPGVLRCDAHLDGSTIGTVYLDLCRCVCVCCGACAC